jgi:uncharacterized protein YdiU (UPF0061 family)
VISPDTFAFDNSYAAELEGFYTPWRGAHVPEPRIVQLNRALAVELSLDPDTLAGAEAAAIFAGSEAPEGATPLAQAYAGHQFGGFSPQLGDGRALLIGELIDRHGVRRDLQLKGSGRTPFSRGGDGKAVLGPVLREYLIGEAMHALGVPTTRALAAVTTGERIRRQDGPEPGAVLARVAASHLRVGTFEYFSARGDTEKVRRLADYAIRRHFPDLAGVDDRYLGLFRGVRDRQAALVAQWMSVGFVHGVMNTDNVTISGETIDYGPCAFIDGYDPAAVFSSIDRNGRYAYGNQPAIAQWNLARFVETLLPLLDPDDTTHAIQIATAEVEAFHPIYQEQWIRRMGAKIGLARPETDDGELINGLLVIMSEHDVDFTRLFRRLADAARGEPVGVRSLFRDPAPLDSWLEAWLARLARGADDVHARATAMDRINPVYIPRNHKVQEALDAATAGDLEPFGRLLDLLARPFERRSGLEEYERRAPDDFGPYRTFCGT